MPVDLFQEVKRAEIGTLPFIKAVFPLAYVDNKYDLRLGMFYEMSKEDYDKTERLMYGKRPDYKIQKKDRVFVLSGCKIPQFKIKDFLKKTGAVMVNTAADATVMIGNSNVTQELITGSGTLDSLSMVLKLEVRQVGEDLEEAEKIRIDDVFCQYREDMREEGVLGRATNLAYTRIGEGGTKSKVCYGVTPYAAQVLYDVLSRKIVTVNEDDLLRQMPTVAVLDRAMYDQLNNMLNSDDEENEKLACELLANCDYSNSDLYLYMLSRNHFSKIASSRYKNVRLFLEESELSDASQIDEETFLGALHDQGKLSKEPLELMLPDIFKKLASVIENSGENPLFHIKIEPRKEIIDILGDVSMYNKEIKPTKLTKDNGNEG